MLQLRSLDQAWTAAEVNSRVQAGVRGFQAQGLQPGQVVAMNATLSPTRICELLALWQCGAVVLPLNPALPPAAQVAALEQAQVRWGLGELLLADAARLRGTDEVTLGAGTWVPPALEQPVSLILTSGSSGRPKLAQHSWGNHVASAAGSLACLPLGPTDRWLAALPIYHVGGLAVVIRCLLAGATLCLPGASLLESCQIFQPSHLSLVPVQWAGLLDQAPDAAAWGALKAVLLGGSAIPAALLSRSHQLGLPVHSSYGSTEMSSQIATTPPGADLPTLLTAGRVLPGRELRLAANGEIQVRGDTLFMGYRDGAKLERVLTADGWFATRDRGQWTASGCLRVLGRLDHVLISGGENIQPEEIEALLLAQPGVRQALVVAVPHARWGQRPVAFVDGVWQTETLRQILGEQLPRFKIPDDFWPWPVQTGLKPSRPEFERRAQALQKHPSA